MLTICVVQLGITVQKTKKRKEIPCFQLESIFQMASLSTPLLKPK